MNFYTYCPACNCRVIPPHACGIKTAADNAVSPFTTIEIGGQSKPTYEQLEAEVVRLRESPSAWRCFHCDAVFSDNESAAEHFGVNETRTPACLIDIAEYRRMEAINARHVDEDTDLHRQIYAMQTKCHDHALRAEEAGYAKGLSACSQMHDALQKAESERDALRAELEAGYDLEWRVVVTSANGRTFKKEFSDLDSALRFRDRRKAMGYPNSKIYKVKIVRPTRGE